jgi:hypothetical protein
MESRMKATVLDPRRRIARLALVVLAILTLSLVPLRAFCELGAANAAQTTGEHHSGGGEGNSDLCCTSIDDSALVGSIMPALQAGPGVALFVALLVSSLVLFGFVAQRLRPAWSPPPPRSYHARSARILR